MRDPAEGLGRSAQRHLAGMTERLLNGDCVGGRPSRGSRAPCDPECPVPSGAMRLLSPTDIRALLAAHDLRPSRALGQNFLADPNTARRIVRLSGDVAGAHVVEVGPGLGSLTLALAEAGARVVALELDPRLAPIVADVTKDLDVRVVQGDALTVDWDELLGDAPTWSMVANLPYNVAVPVLMRAVEGAPMISEFLVMVQREVGERL